MFKCYLSNNRCPACIDKSNCEIYQSFISALKDMSDEILQLKKIQQDIRKLQCREINKKLEKITLHVNGIDLIGTGVTLENALDGLKISIDKNREMYPNGKYSDIYLYLD